jgi:hypothetical protein
MNYYAPADFNDASEDQPTGATFDMTTPSYTMTLNSIIERNIENIEQTVPKSIDWRKRFRDFLSAKNTELLDFLNVTLSSHPTIGKGDAIIRTFGASIITAQNSKILQNIIFDISGTKTIFEEINKDFKDLPITEDPISEFRTKIQYIYEQYRKTGDEILNYERLLKTKLEIFDGIHKNIINLLELDPTSCTEELKELSQKYMAEIFEKHRIQTTYNELIGSYQRFIVLREIISMMRVTNSNENEPLCTICLERPVSHCVVPCGHTYCETCLKRQSTSCFMCRTPVRERVRVYFG